MKKGSTIFLQVVIVALGLVILTLMLRAPLYEGRNTDATLFQVYFNDPFLAYTYLASLAFFVALYQAFKLLGYIGRNEVFSLNSVKALRNIKYCGLTLIGFIVGAEGYLFVVQRKVEEDIAGGVMMGLVLILVSAVIASAAAVFEKALQSAVDLKSENDLTV